MIIDLQCTRRIRMAQDIRQADSGHREAASGALIFHVLVGRLVIHSKCSFQGRSRFQRPAKTDRIVLSQNPAFKHQGYVRIRERVPDIVPSRDADLQC